MRSVRAESAGSSDRRLAELSVCSEGYRLVRAAIAGFGGHSGPC